MRDGSRLTPYMLYQINRLNADFKKRFSVEIRVTSGIRLAQEQIDIFLQRYVTAGNVRGRRVYDTRVWRGVRYYRISSAGTVAVPSTSNHEVQGNRAAVDLRDTGSNAGITRANTERAKWLRANAHKYGLVPSGYGFGEPWHYDVLNIFAAVPGAKPSSSSGYSQVTADVQNAMNVWFKAGLKVDGINGAKTKAAILSAQKFLKSKGLYKGALDGVWGPQTNTALNRHRDQVNAAKPKPKPTAPKPRNPFGISSAKGLQKVARLYGYNGDIDGIWGGGSAHGFAQFLKASWGYRGNDTLGPQMWSAIARWLRSRYGYKGNDVPGPAMRAALQRASDSNYRAL